ncbi:MAG: hypothetical protein FRX48_03629 [Lasallia pustulata]|uniref:Arrestin-like N-terminal domain-containing protein n=1 Tax=Lasallia pustulata TaxID=136370 RepID=A0A5M8PUB9_9LECA|nr:MAG: hypothetical protein FRX48_03629 [Lasallia pustulata]
MSLNIKVNHVRKSKAFHGGDQISGVVEARGPINKDATVVQIKFKGKSQTLIKRSSGESTSRWKDKVKFFRVIKVLFRGPCHLDSGSSTSWPFTFDLPLLTEPPYGNPDITYSKATDKPYAKAAHPLPPTFSLSGSKRGSRYKALITYSLRADLQRNSFFSTSLHKSGSIPVAQSRPRANAASDPPDPQPTTLRQTFTHATSRLLPSHASRARSLREWASDTFTSKAPTAHFTLAAEAPKTLVPGQPIPIYLRLGYDAETSTAPTVPEFRLSRVEFVVKEHVHVRGRGMLSREAHEKPSKVVLTSLWVVDTPRMGSGVLVSGEAVEVGAGAGGSG